MTAAVQQAVCIATGWSGFHHHPMLAPHLTLPIQRGYRSFHCEIHGAMTETLRQ
jgi:hypothetical protein